MKMALIEVQSGSDHSYPDVGRVLLRRAIPLDEMTYAIGAARFELATSCSQSGLLLVRIL